MNAVLIICHKNPKQIVRLISRCISAETRVFVHCDKNMDIDSETADMFAKMPDTVYFSKNRIHGELDDRSLVDIVMLMISECKEVENKESIHFDYYILLSGQDYFLTAIENINEELKKAYPQPFIDCTAYDKNNWIYNKFKYSDRYRVIQKKASALPKGSIKRNILRFVQIHIEPFMSVFFGTTDYHKLKKLNVKLFGGSAWWILPDKSVNYILSEYLSAGEYINILLGSWTPEETFFQTMTMRSEAAELVTVKYGNSQEQDCKTYAFFSDETHPFKGHPYNLTIEKCKEIIALDKYWFCRKVDLNDNPEVFDYLDSII